MSLQDKVQKKIKELESRSKKFWKVPEGTSIIRILPSWKGEDEEFYLEIAVHYRVGPENRVVYCPRYLDQRCPLCDRADKFTETLDAAKQSQAKVLFPTHRVAFNVLVGVDTDTPVAQIWEAPVSALQELLSFFADADYGDFTDPKTGFNVRIQRQGTDLNTKYKYRLARQPSPIKMKDWRKSLRNLDEAFQPLPAKRIIAIAKGLETRDDD